MFWHNSQKNKEIQIEMTMNEGYYTQPSCRITAGHKRGIWMSTHTAAWGHSQRGNQHVLPLPLQSLSASSPVPLEPAWRSPATKLYCHTADPDHWLVAYPFLLESSKYAAWVGSGQKVGARSGLPCGKRESTRMWIDNPPALCFVWPPLLLDFKRISVRMMKGGKGVIKSWFSPN